jgi:hypothetical protein
MTDAKILDKAEVRERCADEVSNEDRAVEARWVRCGGTGAKRKSVEPVLLRSDWLDRGVADSSLWGIVVLGMINAEAFADEDERE